MLYIGASDLRRVSAIDIRDGNVLWRTDVFGWTWGTPLVTADRIYVGAAGGKPYFIDHVASFTVLDRKTWQDAGALAAAGFAGRAPVGHWRLARAFRRHDRRDDDRRRRVRLPVALMNDVTASSVLAVDRIAKAFGGVHAVRDVSFAVAAGELVALIGPNGAGKTTCFNLHQRPARARRRRASRSAARASTASPPRDDRASRRGPHVPGRRDVRVDDGARERASSRCSRMPVRPRRVAARRRRCGAPKPMRCSRASASPTLADAHCATLAYGDAKRVELALALAGKPRLLLMDEPTAGMAPRIARRADAARRRRSRSATASPCCSPSTTWTSCSAFADRVIVLDRGAIIAEGAPARSAPTRSVQAVYLGFDEPAASG